MARCDGPSIERVKRECGRWECDPAEPRLPVTQLAVRLWRLMTGWLEFPNLYEVQRPKGPADLRAIAGTFRPYLEARDWNTIQKETP